MLERLQTRVRENSEDGGFVIGILALILMVLLVFAGFAVDVGAWYARSSQVQRAADAASLAGVVWMPDLNEARIHARAAAARNGVVAASGGISISIDPVPGNSRQLKVTIADPGVEQYFSQLVLNEGPTITRSSTAEYIMPVPLGSPENELGAPSTGAAQLWASISGQTAPHQNGDPYSTRCSGDSCSASGTAPNPNYRPSGYLYAIDVPTAGASRNLTVNLYDAGNYPRSSFPRVETADYQSSNIQFELFQADNTPLDIADNLVPAKSLAGRCTAGPTSSQGGPSSGRGGRLTLRSGQHEGIYKNQWRTLCTVNVGGLTGQWFLRVKSSEITNPTIAEASNTGFNQYGIEATLSGTGVKPRVYAVNDMSLFNNVITSASNTSAEFHLAEVDSIHAGKALRIGLFDPGDGTGAGRYFLNFLGPGGSNLTCTYGARNSTVRQTVTPCRIETRNGGAGFYNNTWLDIDVSIPASYTCSDCWWMVRYDFQGLNASSSPYDRTVWSANIIGDPVHLVD